jgi:SAM-dependent methyltransferase
MKQIDPSVNAYNTYAKKFVENYQSRIPVTARKFADAFFVSRGMTLDLGCGSGRDSAWLADQGYTVRGADPSTGMLKEATTAYSALTIEFYEDSLPELANTHDDFYDNIFCNAVFMHIRQDDLYKSAKNLALKLKDNGTVVLSYRTSNSATDSYGRNFYNLIEGQLISIFAIHALKLIKATTENDDIDPSIKWHILAFSKTEATNTDGVHQVASILENDTKNTTYKYALLRSLCTISKYDRNIIRWVDDKNLVAIPMQKITYEWIRQYWPIVMNDEYISQGKDDYPTKKQIIIRSLLEPYKTNGKGDLNFFLKEVDSNPAIHASLLNKISKSIVEGPIKHSGGAGSKGLGGNHIFNYDSGSDSLLMPSNIWIDIEKHSHWIEDSITMRWARHTVLFNSGKLAQDGDSMLANPAVMLGKMFDILSSRIGDERDTKVIRDLIDQSMQSAEFHCIWTNKSLRNAEFDIDHIIPYAYWGNNDYWNMIPSLSKVNRQKSDKMPSEKLIYQQRDSFYSYWDLYYSRFPKLFTTQINRALGCDISPNTPRNDWQPAALDKMVEKIETFTKRRGLQVWQP